MKRPEHSFDTTQFMYNPETGHITMLGERVGTFRSGGKYEAVAKNGVRVLSHRIAWKLMTGSWPTGELDHINGNGRDNRWSNIRQASSSDNKANRAPQKNNTSGFTGAYFDNTASMWRVSVQFNKRRHQWYASSSISAVLASRLIRRVLHGQFAIEARP